MLITFEGNEGCGKTTQIELLYHELKRKGHKVFLTREPGGTVISSEIRAILLDPRNKGMSGVCETLLYMASRAELVRRVVRPKLESGYVVLCDRWLDATVAYQGYGEGVDVHWIKTLGHKVTAGIRPARTFFLDLPVEAGLRRARRRHEMDRMERKTLSFHRRVRSGYLILAAQEPRRFVRIPVRKSDGIVDVRRKIMKALPEALK